MFFKNTPQDILVAQMSLTQLLLASGDEAPWLGIRCF